MTTPACKISQKSLTKNSIIQSMERKKIGQIQGRISRRMLVAIQRYSMSSSICIPNTTRLARKVVEKTLMKKCYRIMEGCTDGKTYGMTDRCKPVYPPLFQTGGITKTISLWINAAWSQSSIYWISRKNKMYSTKTLVSVRWYSGWLEYSQYAHGIRFLYMQLQSRGIY